MSGLSVWDSDGPDTVIAEDEADAKRILIEFLGYSEEEADVSWTRVPDDKTLEFWDEESCDRPLRITAAKAIAKYGRGLLCSTEF